MSTMIVIADDLTGAAEIGGVAREHGLSVKLVLKPAPGIDWKEDVVIFNSKTREIPEAEINAELEKIMQLIPRDNDYLFYKKTDSLLRGQVGAELSFLMQETGKKSVLLIPANPSRNRIIKDGIYYVEDTPIHQTEFRHDPFFPRLKSNISGMLDGFSESIVSGVIDWEDVSGKFVIPDVCCEAEIIPILRKQAKLSMLLAGGRDFFKVILKEFVTKKTSPANHPVELPDKQHFTFGSLAAANKPALKYILAAGFVHFALTADIIKDPVVFRQWKSVITERCNHFMHTILTSPVKRVSDPALVSDLTHALSEITAVMAKSQLNACHFLITGGKIAELFCDIMDWNHLDIYHAWGDGVVSLKSEKSEHIVTIKPGSYKWPGVVLDAVNTHAI